MSRYYASPGRTANQFAERLKSGCSIAEEWRGYALTLPHTSR
jgi:hypothetical protein